jgi:2-iminobutanoate/2-iminopropanoate deaminase
MMHATTASLRRAVLPVLICGLAATAGAADYAAPKPEFYTSPQTAQRNVPFSDAVRAGDLLFVSGKIGLDATTGKVVPGGIKAEARKALQVIETTLAGNRASLADVVKCTVFLVDIAEWPAFNEVYSEFFKKPYPARSALAASGLSGGARVEVECIAYAPRTPEREQ